MQHKDKDQSVAECMQMWRNKKKKASVADVLRNIVGTFFKLSFIRKTPNKEEWCVFSEKGKHLGCYPSLSQAKKRLQQIEFFKHSK